MKERKREIRMKFTKRRKNGTQIERVTVKDLWVCGSLCDIWEK